MDNNQNENWRDVLNEFADEADSAENPNDFTPKVEMVDNPAQFNNSGNTQQIHGMYNNNINVHALDDYTVQNQYSAASFPVVKKKKSKAPIIALIVVLVIVLGVAGFFAWKIFFDKKDLKTLETTYFMSLSQSAIDMASTKNSMDMDFIADHDGVKDYFKLSYTQNLAAKESGFSLTLGSDDTDLITIDQWMKGYEMTIGIPQLTDKYILVNMEPDAEEEITVSEDTGYLTDIAEIFIKNYITDFTDTAVRTEGSLSYGNINVKCDIDTITITPQKYSDYVCKCLNQMAENESILTGLGVDKETILEAAEDLKTEFQTAADSNGEMVKMRVYSKGNKIIGRDIIDVNEKVVFALYDVNQNGKNTGALLIAEMFTIDFEYNENKGGYTGTADVTVIQNNIYDETESAPASENIKFDVIFDVKDEEGSVTVNYPGTEDTTPGSIQINYLLKEYKDISFPETNESNSVDISSEETLDSLLDEEKLMEVAQKFTSVNEKSMYYIVGQLLFAFGMFPDDTDTGITGGADEPAMDFIDQEMQTGNFIDYLEMMP